MSSIIKTLSDETIIKIAAGEVIENPASVVKELVENSIDANAKNINIEIKNNGASLIKVSDDGDGFNKEDLKLAFKRHTTSKINNINQLYKALTLGFRGEALSSISSASDVTIITKQIDDEIGSISYVDNNGNIISSEEIVTNLGTTIICRDLFKNIPVRKEYLSTKNFEINKTNDLITKLSLSHNDISFSYIKDDKLILKTNSNSSVLNNIYSVLGEDISKNLISINYEDSDFKISGYISNNHLFRSNRNYQYLFVNNRIVNSSLISNEVEKAYGSIIPINRFPVFILYIDINPELIDVNIHPKKDIIKILNIDEINIIIRELINDALFSNLKITEFNKATENKSSNNIFDLQSKKNILYNKSITTSEFLNKESDSENLNIFNDYIEVQNDEILNNYYEPSNSIVSEKVEEYNNKPDVSNKEEITIFKNGYRYIGSLFKQYLLLEDNIDKILYLVDQHGAHERINYEKLVHDYKTNNIPRQQLISGYVVNLNTDSYDKILSINDKLEKIGILVEDFGNNSVIIRELPIYIGDINPEKLINDISDNIDKINTNIFDIDPYKVMKQACSASVKTGEIISNIEANKLIERLLECEMPLTCPHGRPTIIRITKNELDKEFFRIQGEGK